MAIDNDDLLVLQKNGGGELRKATVGALLAQATTTDLQAVTDAGNTTTNGATFGGTIIAGDNIRANQSDPTTVGVEVNGSLGIVHLKPKDGAVTPLEIFGPGSVVQNQSSSIFRVTPAGEIHINHDAIALKADGNATFEGAIEAASIDGGHKDLGSGQVDYPDP